MGLLKKINYNEMLDSALIDVVKNILLNVAKNGFYKKQHLYITFATNHPDVSMSSFLHEDFEEEMTIVLQHEFWDLRVDDFGFSISLAFEHADETLYIPFCSITSITDPSEKFVIELKPNFENIRKDKKKVNNKKEPTNNIIKLDFLGKR